MLFISCDNIFWFKLLVFNKKCILFVLCYEGGSNRVLLCCWFILYGVSSGVEIVSSVKVINNYKLIRVGWLFLNFC